MRFQAKTILYFFLLGILASCRESKEVSFWNLIDGNTVLVYESNKPVLVRNGLVDSIFYRSASTEFVAGLQSINKNSYEFLYSFKITNAEFEKLNSSKKASIRLLDGVSIYELKKNGRAELIWVNIDGFLVLSKSRLLIENAIRVYHSSPSRNFKTQNPQLFGFVTIKSDAGNMYINYDQLSKVSIPLFQTLQRIPLFQSLASASVLDITQHSDQISLSGFTLDSLDKTWGLFRFQNQNPVKIDVMRFVPNTSKALIHYGLSNVDALITGDADEPKKSDIQDEVGVCVLDNDAYVVLVKVTDGHTNDTFEYAESYAGYDLLKATEIALIEPIKALLPERNFTYVLFKDDYLFLSENLEDLKQLIDAIEADDTWGRSVSFRHFFNSCLQEGNVSVFYNAAMLFGDYAGVEWKPILDSVRLTSATWGSIQFNSLDNHFFTSANFQLESQKKANPAKVTRKAHELPANLASAYVVKNHTDGSNELLVQDSTFKVYLFSKLEGVQWVYTLNEKIEQAQQMDYFKNGKLQYVITTSSYIYLVDRLGRDVEGFPKKKDRNFRFSEVVDYDKSRNYRLALTSGDRDIFILDKSMKELEGWSPKKLNAKIRFAPKHYRIGGKDFFVVITEDGQLHVFNRKGDYEKGFPLTITKNISGDYFLEQGSTLANSAIYSVSTDGTVQKLTLDGKSVNENLVRGNKSTFLLTTTSGKSGFYFFRIDQDKIAVFDRRNQLVFERQNPGSQDLKPAVIASVTGQTYFCLFDEEQKLSYFFNTIGNAVINRPLETTLLPIFEVNQKSKQVNVFSIYYNSITSTELN